MDIASPQVSKTYFAEHGGSGSGNNKIGKDGESRILEVPLGTVAKDTETGEVLFEITTHGEEQIMLEGGKGGREMYTLNLQPTKHHAMLNLELQVKKVGSY